MGRPNPKWWMTQDAFCDQLEALAALPPSINRLFLVTLGRYPSPFL
jgi:hypothetical protein